MDYQKLVRVLRETCGDRIYGVRVKRFRHRDHIIVETSIGIDVRFYLRTKLENLTEDQVKEMCNWIP